MPTRGQLCPQAFQRGLQLVVAVLQVLWAEPDPSSSRCGHWAQERGMEPAPGEPLSPQLSRAAGAPKPHPGT